MQTGEFLHFPGAIWNVARFVLDPNTDPAEKNHLGQPFVFHAAQRLKAFNSFVVFSVFANGRVAVYPS